MKKSLYKIKNFYRKFKQVTKWSFIGSFILLSLIAVIFLPSCSIEFVDESWGKESLQTVQSGGAISEGTDFSQRQDSSENSGENSGPTGEASSDIRDTSDAANSAGQPSSNSPLPAADAVTVEIEGMGQILLPVTTVEIQDKTTVADVMKAVRTSGKIKMAINGTGYVSGIGELYEGDHGAMSGWLYEVNGERPGYSCSQYELYAGDRIRWVYTTDGL